MQQPCPICNDTGIRLIEGPKGAHFATDCDCRIARRVVRLIEQARVPKNYAHCTLEDYETQFPSATPSLAQALVKARNFVTKYPLETEGKGLLFVGRPGLGKTHLAVGLLKALISERNVKGLFVDYRDLLKQVQNTYDPSVAATELSILRPVFEAEVLVIDDLGASKPSDWIFDTVAHILNSRYNDRLTTIVTTNFANRPQTESAEYAKKNEAQRIMSDRTLGDRIGDRVLSRLQEMCVIVEMSGVDFRTDVKRARFGDKTEAVPTPIVETIAEAVESAGGTTLEIRTKISARKSTSEIDKVSGQLPLIGQKEEPLVGGARMGSLSKRKDVSGRD
ncbi:MAG TPA: ATP-binding protein [Acidobacteriaceae bacterium]